MLLFVLILCSFHSLAFSTTLYYKLLAQKQFSHGTCPVIKSAANFDVHKFAGQWKPIYTSNHKWDDCNVNFHPTGKHTFEVTDILLWTEMKYMKKAYVGKAEVYNGIWGTYGAPWTYKVYGMPEVYVTVPIVKYHDFALLFKCAQYKNKHYAYLLVLSRYETLSEDAEKCIKHAIDENHNLMHYPLHYVNDMRCKNHEPKKEQMDDFKVLFSALYQGWVQDLQNLTHKVPHLSTSTGHPPLLQIDDGENLGQIDPTNIEY